MTSMIEPVAAAAGGRGPGCPPPAELHQARPPRRDVFSVVGPRDQHPAGGGRTRPPGSGDDQPWAGTDPGDGDRRDGGRIVVGFARREPPGPAVDPVVLTRVAEATARAGARTADATPDPVIDLARFIDRDLAGTGPAVAGEEAGSGGTGDEGTGEDVAEDGTAGALDLGPLYGPAPGGDPVGSRWEPDGLHLATGPAATDDPGASAARLAWCRFHNRVLDDLARRTPSSLLRDTTRREVVLHYQWIVRHDFLPRLVDPAVLDEVWDTGRRLLDVGETVIDPDDAGPARPSLPAEAGDEGDLVRRLLRDAGGAEPASGQQLADAIGVNRLAPEAVLRGDGSGLDLTAAAPDGRPVVAPEAGDRFARHTPLWFYAWREAELNGGRLTGVGGRVVAEVFHRAMARSRHSLVAHPAWTPTFGRHEHSFDLTDLTELSDLTDLTDLTDLAEAADRPPDPGWSGAPAW